MRLDIGTKTHPGVFAAVDGADYDIVSQYKWAATRRRKKLYVRGIINGRDVLLHRFLMGEPEGLCVDHIDGDPLNNRRENLRVCSRQENTAFAVENGAYPNLGVNATHIHTVKRRLADGSVRVHRYHRKTKERLENGNR